MRHKILLNILMLGALTAPSLAQAGDKFDFSLGFFDLSSESVNSKGAKTSGSSSALGVYQIEYRHSFFSRLELGLGYSLMASGTVGGDLGYGLDLTAYYYPFSFAGPQKWDKKDSSSSISSTELWRPFVGASFNQRTFSTSSVGFAGFGIVLGTERQFSEKMSLLTEFRYISLGGSALSATSEELVFGVSYAF